MRLAGLLRLTALGIALMCWLDPPSSVSLLPPVIVDAAIVRSPRDTRPARNGRPETVLDAARQLAVQLTSLLGSDGTVRVREVEAGGALPCDAAQPCVVFTEGAAPSIPADRRGPVTIVAVGGELSPNVELLTVEPGTAHLAGQGVARVTLAAHGMAGGTSRVRLLDGSAVVGEAVHAWSLDGTASIELPWWPVAEGARTLTTRVLSDGKDELTLVDNELAAETQVAGETWRVALVERRPSWSATFVRRALEGDRRFELAARTDVAPRVRVASVGDFLSDAALDATRVVVVGAPDALTADDVERLEPFVRQRGGALVLVPDRAMDGPVARLISHRWREQLESEPSGAAGLWASEWLVASDLTSLDRVWVESTHGPAVVATPAGAGMVVVAGALDAWRYRGRDGGFDRFWRANIAALAMAAGRPLEIALVGDGPTGTGRLSARVRARSVRDVHEWQATALRSCDGGEPVPLRLWPADAAGAFTAHVPIGARTGCRVGVIVAGVGDAGVDLRDDPRDSTHRWTAEDMDGVAARTRGVVIRDGDLRPLVQSWLSSRGTDRRTEVRHPMRTWWWVLPFALCLGGEWWLRRRAGLR